ncbi:hypothetical protein AAFF_G00034190 [Aldrovandia affinis]|uniref:Uncharacterized protein n=1 Tax=Aldrovandia affinis TaxID=143900 RepID=A0AAD7WFM0_9TELE|nr:hypothetical protein AAFF_G00034190 [Aldrovandia affinis]
MCAASPRLLSLELEHIQLAELSARRQLSGSFPPKPRDDRTQEDLVKLHRWKPSQGRRLSGHDRPAPIAGAVSHLSRHHQSYGSGAFPWFHSSDGIS